MIKDIYSIERRTDLRKICCRVDDYIKDQSTSFRFNFYRAVDSCIKHYEYNRGALNIDDYFEDLQIDLEEIRDKRYFVQDNIYLLYIQAILALSFFYVDYIEPFNPPSHNKELNDFFTPLRRMIKENLELINYTYHLREDNRIIITKRDAHVDSVIELVRDEDIQFTILQYIDFRNKTNIESKKQILRKLFLYYESILYKGSKLVIKKSKTSKDLNPSDVFGEITNNFNIRHHQKNNNFNITSKGMSDKEINDICDIAFYMFLEIIRIPELFKFYDSYLEIKGRFEDVTNSTKD